MTRLPLDSNGLPITALTPISTTSASLSGSASVVLAADDSRLRIVRLLTDAADAKIGVGDNAQEAGSGSTATGNNTAHMPLMAEVAEHFKLEAGMNLYAAGSGTLHITIMG